MNPQSDIDLSSAVIRLAQNAKRAAASLAALSLDARNRALDAIAGAIDAHRNAILSANELDLASARNLVNQDRLSESLYQRLKLNQSKLDAMIEGVRKVRLMDDPLGCVTLATELDTGLNLYRVTCPIGVIGVIFESRPDALIQISSLALKSGNAVLLKGGREAERTNKALFTCVSDAASGASGPPGAFSLLESRSDVEAMLQAEGLIDLIIPRGSNELVRYIQQNTSIPVLGHAEGICHIYVDKTADLSKALRIVVDAKTSYPAVCNAVETLLVHRSIAAKFIGMLLPALAERSVEVRCDPGMIASLGLTGVKEAIEEDWRTEYCDLVLSIRMLDSMEQAIDHINTYGSHHTDSMIAEDKTRFDAFFARVDSAGVFLNASTRFADGFRYGFGAEVGISTGKLHPRGPVGLDGLVTYKYKLTGEGHVVEDYSDKAGRRFTHRPLSGQ